jgi:hypothetical protein
MHYQHLQPPATLRFIVLLIFHPEYEDHVLLRNVGSHTDYMAAFITTTVRTSDPTVSKVKAN